MDSAIQQDSNLSNHKIMLTREGCPANVIAIKDALEALEGRWKLLIMLSLSMGTKRFKEITKEIHGITDKMLSKELKALETNQLVKRHVYESYPPRVEYSLTEHGRSIGKVLDELYHWGLAHRKQVIGK